MQEHQGVNRDSSMPCNETRRFYRLQHQDRKGWVGFQVRYRETDLWVRAQRNLEQETLTAILNCRRQLERYIAEHPPFLKSLTPLPEDPLAPPLVKAMLFAARSAGVGPMASVAGAVAQEVALSLRPFSPSVIVENGGDCYLDIREETTIGIYAGPHSPFSGNIGLRFEGSRFPLGICTSSGTVGPSLSFGRADAVTVAAKDAALADAAATALGNLVKTPSHIEEALERARTIPSLEGVLIVIKDKLGIWGNLEIARL
ncbi:MAG TPA: UPF0280 family protein [Syntrophobacter fumaroxidans]|nr:UPF0280 family protein [Syntrophobacter fumaroxidans]